MKKIFFATAIAALAGYTTSAQGQNEFASLTKKERREARKENKPATSGPDISYQTMMQFAMDFPDAQNVSWSRGKFEEVSFMNDNKLLTAYYDANSELIGTISSASFSDLPVKAQKYIENKYPGYTVQQVILFDDNESNETDMTYLEQTFEDEDNYFVELKNDNSTVVVKADMNGWVEFFKKL